MITPDDSFESIQVVVKCYTFFPQDFDNRDIYGFIFPAKTLKTSRFSDCFYKVQSVSVSSPKSIQNGQRVQYDITFTCEPFKYAVENPRVDVVNGTNVHNTGNRFAKPSYTIEGTGDVALITSGVPFSITGLNGVATIDSEKGLAYTATDIINVYTSGNFPLLMPGQNVVGWTGNVSRVTVQKNERWY